MKRLILIVVLVAVAVGITYLVKPSQKVDCKPGVHATANLGQPVVLSDYVYYPGQDGQTALELLKEVATVEGKQYDFGMFVESINGHKPDSEHFWKLYYNAAEAQVGADKLETHDCDAIEWIMETIQK